jgi:DNA polymerase III subunit gamma/tau
MKNSEEYELHKKYRPKTIEDVRGQDAIKKILSGAIETDKIPHACLFHGTRGTGKTTLARILARAIEPDVSEHELDTFVIQEVDVALYSGVDTARALMSTLSYPSMTTNGTGKKIVILDEVHRASKAFSDALLKQLEEPKEHVYFILCTTEFLKIPGTVSDRCMKFNLKPLAYSTMQDFVKEILVKERSRINDTDIISIIAEKSKGIPRLALRYIETCANLEEIDDIMLVLEVADEEPEVKELIDLILGDSKSWSKASKLLRALHRKNNNPESLRIQIVTYINGCMLNTKDNAKANYLSDIASLFLEPLEYSVTAFTKVCHAVCLIMTNKS